MNPSWCLLLSVAALPFSNCAASRACVGTAVSVKGSATTLTSSFQHSAADGMCLQAYEWKPTQPPRGIVVVVHGIRDHATRYSQLADALASSGLIVYAQDMRGHGNSGGDRQRWESIEQIVEDVDLLAKEARRRNPNIPTFLYGHSLGGLVSTRYALAHQPEMGGLVLSGAALKLLPGISGAEKTAARVFGTLLPGLQVQAVDDTQFVRTAAAKAEFAADSLIDHSKLPARSAASALNAIESVSAEFTRLTLPLLIFHGTQDFATNVEGSKELHAQASSTDKTLKLMEGVSHDLLHEPEAATVIETTSRWIGAHLRPPP
jgi:acylglycerol lipase